MQNEINSDIVLACLADLSNAILYINRKHRCSTTITYINEDSFHRTLGKKKIDESHLVLIILSESEMVSKAFI